MKPRRPAQAAWLLSSFYGFCRNTKIIKDICEQPHVEMCAELEDCLPVFGVQDAPQKKKIYLAPRSTFKTSLIKAFIIFCYLKYPNIRIVYGRATHEEAKKVLRSIREAFEENPVLLDVWGNVADKAKIWAEEMIVCARSNPMLTEPTVDTTGLGLSLTGSHPDLIILDDLVNDVNYESELTSERCRDLLLSAEPVLEMGGSIIVCGTRWQPNDVYGWLMANDELLVEEGKERQWKRYIRSVYLDPEHKELFFPTRLSEAKLAELRKSLATKMRLFSSWYYNQPYEEGTKLFPTGLLDFYEASFWRYPAPYLDFGDSAPVPVYVTMTIDPAPTVGKYSDFTGVAIVGTDHFGVWWVLHAAAYKLTPFALAAEMYSLILKYEPQVIGIETGQADPEFVARLQTKINSEEIPLERKPSIQSYSAKSDERRGERGKMQRIEALEPYFREGFIQLPRDGSIRELLLQLDGYPSLDHDDVLDALSMQRHFVRALKEVTLIEVEDSREAEEERLSWGPNGPPPAGTPRKNQHLMPGCNRGLGSQFMRG